MCSQGGFGQGPRPRQVPIITGSEQTMARHDHLLRHQTNTFLKGAFAADCATNKEPGFRAWARGELGPSGSKDPCGVQVGILGACDPVALRGGVIPIMSHRRQLESRAIDQQDAAVSVRGGAHTRAGWIGCTTTFKRPFLHIRSQHTTSVGRNTMSWPHAPVLICTSPKSCVGEARATF